MTAMIDKKQKGINIESKHQRIKDAYKRIDNFCEQKGLFYNCPKGCSKCCGDYFFVSENEFLYILAEAINNKHLRNKYRNRAIKYKNWFKSEFPDEVELLKSCVDYNQLLSSYNKKLNELSTPCIFLSGGRCTIYNCRPIICRGYGSTSYCQEAGNTKTYNRILNDIKINVSLTFSEKHNTVIGGRAYPLFYWFSDFLDKYKNEILKKLEIFSLGKEQDLYDYIISTF